MRKRHWYQNYNFLAPFINLKNTIKHWWLNKDWRERKKINDNATKILIIIMIIIGLLYGANKVIAYEYNEIQSQRLEMAKLEKEAIAKESRIKQAEQIKYKQEQEEKARIKKQNDEAQFINAYYEKEAKKKLKIGSYIKVDVDGEEWIGKIKSIHGQEITTTDNWHCYWGDEIKYSELKEYNKFIKQNSKG